MNLPDRKQNTLHYLPDALVLLAIPTVLAAIYYLTPLQSSKH